MVDSYALTIPARFDYWLHCADTWAHILKMLDMSKIHTAYDLCPGWSPKLELAISRTAFTGDVYCIDQSQNALDTHALFMKPLAPSFTVHYQTQNILKDLQQPSTYPDLIIGNHIIDDLLLHEYCLKNTIDELTLFERPEALPSVWNRIFVDESLIAGVVAKLSSFLLNVSQSNTLILLSQYAGYQERLWGFPQETSLLYTIQSALLSSGKFFDIHHNLDEPFSHIYYPYFSKNECIFLKKS